MNPYDGEIVIKRLGENIQALRKQQGLTQAQFAFECGIPRSLLQRIENGKDNTTVKTVLSIANALNVEIEKLFENVKENN